jgi:hypothetical protein
MPFTAPKNKILHDRVSLALSQHFAKEDQMVYCSYSEMDWYCAKQEGHEGPHESVSLGQGISPIVQYIHVRHRLPESTDSREIWHYESMWQRSLPEYVTALRAKGHDRFSFRLLRAGEPWWPVP